MDDILPTSRIGAQPRALHFSYEKAGLTVADQPIPWNAEAVIVEATLHLPSAMLRRQTDFSLRIAGSDPNNPAAYGGGSPVAAEAVHKLDASDPQQDHRYSVTFRVPPSAVARSVEVMWRERSLGQLELPVVGRDEFLDTLRLQMPTVFVRLGSESVACQTFVASQCRGLTAGGVLTSSMSLAPLADVDLAVEFRNERTGEVQRAAGRLNSTQLAARQALLSVASPQHPRHLGTWTVTWFVAGREMARQRTQGISLRQFQRSLRVSDTRFVMQGADGTVTVSRQAPKAEQTGRVGPCFLVCSREPGMAGLCPLRITAQRRGNSPSPVLLDQDVLISDGLSVVAPGTLDQADRQDLIGFDLSLGNRSLCVLALTPAPAAAFNSEGGFRPAPVYSWSPAADEELNERLGRLLEEKFKGL